MSARPSSTEPLWWLLFSAGGVASAMLMPALILVTGVAVPAGWVETTELLELIRNPLTRLILFGLVSLSLFHWAHRFRYALIDLGFGELGRQQWLFYGVAGVGTLAAIWLLAVI